MWHSNFLVVKHSQQCLKEIAQRGKSVTARTEKEENNLTPDIRQYFNTLFSRGDLMQAPSVRSPEATTEGSLSTC